MALPKNPHIKGKKRGKPGRPIKREIWVEQAIREGNPEQIIRSIMDWNFYHISYRCNDNLNIRDQWACFRLAMNLLVNVSRQETDEPLENKEFEEFVSKTLKEISGGKILISENILPAGDGEQNQVKTLRPSEQDPLVAIKILPAKEKDL